MEFKELISDFSTRHGLEGLDVEDDKVAFNVDDIPIFIVVDGDEIAMISEIGEPPNEGKADFADLLLAANFSADTIFAKMQESNTYVLIQRLPLTGLDGAAFDKALEELVNQAETWRNLLAEFRPAAAAAAAAESETPSFGTTGFLRV
ncbi:MAG: type III secretion system chaperone [Lentisphaeria bacterium]|nr:type III secretion system chaperone [Lentisphaeria bacterium]